MRSRGADRFNHDLEADRYDDRVADEAHPIRRGYGACIRALAEDLRRGPGPCELPLLELGAGTGALTSQMPFDRRVIAIDISPKMLAIAGARLVGRPVELVQADLLAWVTESDEPLGSVASAFALHHLESDEKRLLIDALAQRMVPGARLCIGDLGLAGADAHACWMSDASAGAGVTQSVAEAYFWRWDVAEAQLWDLGFRVRRRKHGPLISSLVAMR